jgi:putative aldouronate transport system permease protein
MDTMVSTRKGAGQGAGRDSPARLRRRVKFRAIAPLLLMTVPIFIMGVVFNYAPIWGWSMAFVKYQPGKGILGAPFAGLHYFKMLFEGGSTFLLVMRNTVALSLLGMLVLPLAVAFAVLVSEARGRGYGKFVQIASSFPYFVSWIIVYSIFFFFCSVDGGVINQLLLRFGLIREPIDFLGNADWSWFILTFASIWKNLGYTAIVFIASIAGIDQELFEAAQIDGASRFRKIWHITVPLIMPTFAVMTVLTVGQLLNLGFEQFWPFRNFMTVGRVEVLDTYIYATGIGNFQFSYATAVGIFKTLVSCLMLFIANGIFKRFMNRTII